MGDVTKSNIQFTVIFHFETNKGPHHRRRPRIRRRCLGTTSRRPGGRRPVGRGNAPPCRPHPPGQPRTSRERGRGRGRWRRARAPRGASRSPRRGRTRAPRWCPRSSRGGSASESTCRSPSPATTGCRRRCRRSPWSRGTEKRS